MLTQWPLRRPLAASIQASNLPSSRALVEWLIDMLADVRDLRRRSLTVRFHRTLKDEFFSARLRKKLYGSV